MKSLLVEWYENDNEEFVAKCPNGQKVKVEHRRPRGFLQNTPILSW